jgi:peroxiredoxin (alkyl hydroperoxide reductase subunit C)
MTDHILTREQRLPGSPADVFAFFAPTGVANRALVITGPDLKVLWSWEGEHPGILPGANLIFDGLAVSSG